MSQIQRYPIRCPQCDHEQDVELYESVNVQEDPSLKPALMTNALNTVGCEQCGSSFRVEKSLLYHDPANGFMIHLIPARGDAVEYAQGHFSEWLQELGATLPAEMEAPDVHLVFSRIELVERIFLLEAGLNERIIEYIKYIIYTRNMQRLNPAEKALLFNTEDSTEEALCFVVQDIASLNLEELLQYSRQAYNGLCEMFDCDDQTPSLMELFPGPYISARALLLKDAPVSEPNRRRV